jgi:hypothetical protein
LIAVFEGVSALLFYQLNYFFEGGDGFQFFLLLFCFYSVLFRFQIKDDIKAAREKATKAYKQYAEVSSTKPTKIAP